ncbi:MAG: hypothetical protein NVSMB52_05870 [Chloroflexota bacterium]
MIVHLLLVKVRENLSEEQHAELNDSISSLQYVPGVSNLTWGEDFSGRSKGYTHAAVMQFADRHALHAYGTHELHLRVVASLEKLAEERLVVDYDTGTSGIST